MGASCGAPQSDVRMMVDAEHSYFQPAINHAAVELQRRYNRKKPIIYNTYQCYLTDSHERCAALPPPHSHLSCRARTSRWLLREGGGVVSQDLQCIVQAP